MQVRFYIVLSDDIKHVFCAVASPGFCVRGGHRFGVVKRPKIINVSYHPRYDIPTIYRYIVHRYTGTDIRYTGEYRYQPILTSMRPVCHSHTVYNNKMQLHDS